MVGPEPAPLGRLGLLGKIASPSPERYCRGWWRCGGFLSRPLPVTGVAPGSTADALQPLDQPLARGEHLRSAGRSAGRARGIGRCGAEPCRDSLPPRASIRPGPGGSAAIRSGESRPARRATAARSGPEPRPSRSRRAPPRSPRAGRQCPSAVAVSAQAQSIAAAGSGSCSSGPRLWTSSTVACASWVLGPRRQGRLDLVAGHQHGPQARRPRAPRT